MMLLRPSFVEPRRWVALRYETGETVSGLDGGCRACRDVFTACPDRAVPEDVALLATFLE
jgi:hypothetical protein